MQPDLAKFCNFGTILGRCPGTDSIKVLHYTNFLIILIGRKICFRQSKCSKTCAVNIGPWKIFRGFTWILAKFSTYFDKFVILLYKFFLLQNCQILKKLAIWSHHLRFKSSNLKTYLKLFNKSQTFSFWRIKTVDFSAMRTQIIRVESRPRIPENTYCVPA